MYVEAPEEGQTISGAGEGFQDGGDIVSLLCPLSLEGSSQRCAKKRKHHLDVLGVKFSLNTENARLLINTTVKWLSSSHTSTQHVTYKYEGHITFGTTDKSKIIGKWQI